MPKICDFASAPFDVQEAASALTDDLSILIMNRQSRLSAQQHAARRHEALDRAQQLWLKSVQDAIPPVHRKAFAGERQAIWQLSGQLALPHPDMTGDDLRALTAEVLARCQQIEAWCTEAGRRSPWGEGASASVTRPEDVAVDGRSSQRSRHAASASPRPPRRAPSPAHDMQLD